MKRLVSLGTLLLFIVGTNSAAPASKFLQGSRKERSPSAQGEKNAAVRVTCEWVSSDIINPTKLAQDNAIKLALYDAVVSRRGIVQAKKVCATIEGDPLPIYATAKGGKIKITFDYSQDRWMRLQGLLSLFGGNSYTTRKVEIGYIDQGKFIPLNGPAPNGSRLFLRLKGKEYF